MRDGKEVDPNGEEEPGRVERGEAIIKIYYRGKSISKNKSFFLSTSSSSPWLFCKSISQITHQFFLKLSEFLKGASHLTITYKCKSYIAQKHNILYVRILMQMLCKCSTKKTMTRKMCRCTCPQLSTPNSLLSLPLCTIYLQ